MSPSGKRRDGAGKTPLPRALPDEYLLTSEDLFGDLVDDLEKDGGLTPTDAPVAAVTPTPRPLPAPPSADAVDHEGDERSSEGKPFGPYRLLNRVAVGGMAEVFRARQTGIGGFEKVVALKRLLPHLSRQKDLVDLFINEAKMVAVLTHPNIVQTLDLGKIDKSYYIAMEYVHGRDLRTLQSRARELGVRFPREVSVLIGLRIASALGYAHHKKDAHGRSMHIVHRDVSPQNILISFDGDVKLVDFGIAKAASKAKTTARHLLRGKLLYMSPEQAAGAPADHRSDLFSLGIVLYELVTGRKPFHADSEKAILELVRTCRVAPPSSFDKAFPEKLERVVMKALERDPDDRYQDANGFFRALERTVDRDRLATERDLAEFVEDLLGEDATAAPRADPRLATKPEPPPIDPDLESAKSVPPKDAMSVEKLLSRFRTRR